jgi:hypothetical protein
MMVLTTSEVSELHEKLIIKIESRRPAMSEKIEVSITGVNADGSEMDIREMFFEIFPAVRAIFEMGFLPTEDSFLELSDELYARYEESEGKRMGRLYAIVPPDNSPSNPISVLQLVTEEEVPVIMKGVAKIRATASSNGCDSDEGEEILNVAARHTPAIFLEGTRFENKNHSGGRQKNLS